MILIVGGTGTLGSIVARQLLAAGERVRVMTRSLERGASLRDAGADVVQGDLIDATSVARACPGADALVCAAHSLLGRGRRASARIDGAAHRRLIGIAKASGVRHLVYTSVYDCGPAWHAVPFFRIKLEIETVVRQSGLTFTILRPTPFMDVHAHTMIGERVLRGRRVVMFGRGERPRNFVAAADVAPFVVRALYDPMLSGETLDIGGPENLSNMDVVRIYERLSGRRASVTHVPLPIPRLAYPMIRPLHQGVAQFLQASILAETTEQFFDPSRLRARFSARLTPLSEWAAERIGTRDAQPENVSVP